MTSLNNRYYGKGQCGIVRILEYKKKIEASRGAAARCVTVNSTGCGFDPHSRRWNIYLNLYFVFFGLVLRLSAALSSATQHAMPPEFGRKWGKVCLIARFPLPTLLCAGYSVKPTYLFIFCFSNLNICHMFVDTYENDR